MLSGINGPFGREYTAHQSPHSPPTPPPPITPSLVQIMACCLFIAKFYLHRCWFIVNLVAGNKFQWSLNKNKMIFVRQSCRLPNGSHLCFSLSVLNTRLKCPLCKHSGLVRLNCAINHTPVVDYDCWSMHRAIAWMVSGHIAHLRSRWFIIQGRTHTHIYICVCV